MKAELRLREVAALEGVSVRQVQRWVRKGELCATILRGRERLVARQDYLNFKNVKDALPSVGPGPTQAAPEPSETPSIPHPAPEPTSGNSPRLPAHLIPSNPNAPLTNVPAAHSSNWCSAETMRAHLEQNHRDLMHSLIGGKDNGADI